MANLGDVTDENFDNKEGYCVKEELYGCPKSISGNATCSDKRCKCSGKSTQNLKTVNKRAKKFPLKRYEKATTYEKEVSKNFRVVSDLEKYGVNKPSELHPDPDATDNKVLQPQVVKVNAKKANVKKANATKAKPQQYKISTDFICIPCEQLFPSMQGLVYHNQRKHSDVNAWLDCKLCSKTFKIGLNLKRHMNTVHTSETDKVHCDLCGKAFSCKERVSKHIRVTHSEIRHYACKVCLVKFKDRKTLNVHLTTHSTETPFECNICKTGFKTNHKLKIHMIKHSDQQLKCNFCYRPFLNKINLEKHLKLFHTDEADPNTCEICKEVFKTRWKLDIHMKLHKNPEMDVFACDKCDKVFDSKLQCKRHIFFHSISTTTLDCPICDKTFKTNPNLKKHMFINHINDDPVFECKTCGKSFKHSGAYYTHRQKVHSNQAFYECAKCKQTFRWKQRFDRHTLKCGNENETKQQTATKETTNRRN